MSDVLNRRALNRATLARQLLLARETATVGDATARLLAIQAQEARPPFIGLWSRLADFSGDRLHAALHAREVVRSTYVRGTLHLTGASDYLAFRALVEPSLVAGATATVKRLPGPKPDQERLLTAAREVLADGPLDFAAIRARLQERFPDVNDRVLGYLVRLSLPLVMVPTDDRWAFPATAAFTPAETWLGAPPAAESSPEAFVTRYLAAFGPATPGDLRTFSGLRLSFEALDLRTFTTEDGQVVHDLPDAPRPDPDTPAPARFLPDFDSLLLAHGDRSRVVPAEFRSRLITKNLRIPAAFLWDGVAVGTWKIARRTTSAVLTLTPFAPLPAAAVTALTEEGHRLLRFTDPDAAGRDVRVLPPA